jgi:hypothetical protein
MNPKLANTFSDRCDIAKIAQFHPVNPRLDASLGPTIR